MSYSAMELPARAVGVPDSTKNAVPLYFDIHVELDGEYGAWLWPMRDYAGSEGSNQPLAGCSSA
jgi:hypothetical protein